METAALSLFGLVCVLTCSVSGVVAGPTVVNTWGFTDATDAAWESLRGGGGPVAAVVAGCSRCERDQCDGNVGFGGSPDEAGETTLDAMIMDGETHDVGAVAALRRVKDAIAVAHAVMKYTTHTMLAGDQATAFAVEMGFKEESLQTNKSRHMWETWKQNHCQPNFRQNVVPDPRSSCGPYKPVTPVSLRDNRTRRPRHRPHHSTRQHCRNTPAWREEDRASRDPSAALGARSRGHHRSSRFNPWVNAHNHDTIGMVVLDSFGNLASGTSTNGATNKVPGRVGDSPIMGAGSYVDNDVGGCAATGDGDVMMRFLPCYAAVEEMRHGMNASVACENALRRITRFYPRFSGAVVALTKQGQHGAACRNLSTGFPYSVRAVSMRNSTVYHVTCGS